MLLLPLCIQNAAFRQPLAPCNALLGGKPTALPGAVPAKHISCFASPNPPPDHA